jgi:nucleoid-associated protein YgaU
VRRWVSISLLWSAGVVAHRALWLAGGHLDLPAGASLGDLDSWFRTVDPGEAPVVVAWTAGLAISAWLVGAIALQALAATSGGTCLRVVADLVSPRSLQRLGRSVAGLSLTAGLAAAAPSAVLLASTPGEPPPASDDSPAGPAASGTATMSRLDEVEASTVPTVVAPSTSSTPATPTSVTSAAGDGEPPVDGPPTGPAGPSAADAAAEIASTPSASPSAPFGVADGPPRPPAPPAVPVSGLPSAPSSEHLGSETVIVEPGMSFWSIAAEALVDAGRPSDDASVSRYWRRVIDANRSRLVAPDNPDLLLPGQVLVLPPH